MKFHSHAQEKAYKKAMKHRYKGIAFDIDGTLTPFSRFLIPGALHKTLSTLPPDLKLVLCTGRNMKYIRRVLENILHYFPDPEAARKQWSIISDNGGAVYVYSPQKKDFKKIHEVTWPEEKISMEDLQDKLKKKFNRHIVIKVRNRTMVVVFPKYFYLFPRLVRRLSARLAKKLQTLFSDLNLVGTLKTQNSGLGSLIIPNESGKGNAVKHWAAHHKIALSDLLCVGDSPGKGENDEDLLSGKFGVAFSVGKQTKSVYPLPVLDEKGRKLWGPAGTEKLLRTIPLA